MTSRMVFVFASALLLSFASTPSHAATLTVDFAFGGVTGEIDGLTPGGTNETAMQVIITADPFVHAPIDMIAPGSVTNNSFDVDDAGDITGANFLATNGATRLCLSTTSAPTCPGVTAATLSLVGPGGDENTSGSSVTYTSTLTGTPLPATLPLFETGLGALVLLGWRRKRRVQGA